MLPKFASHVLHQTQRAAASAQNHAIRNVLGLQNQGATPSSLTSWNNAASGSSSGWGSAGGAKSSSGNWFYQGYTGAGRAVTQANSSAHDISTSRVDEDEDFPRRRSALVIKTRSRPRSSSVHLTGAGRLKRAENLGVLKIVQLHQARNQHVLAGPSSSSKAEIEDAESPRSPLRRRNSTASSVASLESVEPDANAERAIDGRWTDSAAPQKAGPFSSADLEDMINNAGAPADLALDQRFERARQANDPALAAAEVKNFRATHPKPSVVDYNGALHTLVATRRGGEPLRLILETYNEMLTRQIKPNAGTYKIMLLALCERDREVERVLTQMEARLKRRKASGRDAARADEKQLKALRKEENFGSAMLIFEAAQTLFRTKDSRLVSLGSHVYNALLRSCMLHANTDAAIRIWGVLEQLDGFTPDASCYLHLLGTYVSAHDIDSAKDVFGDFLHAANEKRVSWSPKNSDDDTSHILADDLRSGKARATQMLFWVKMVEAYFKASNPQSAIGLLEKMMDTKAGLRFSETDVPPPCPAVYTAFIRGFLEMDDVDSALKWFDRMLSQSGVASHHPLLPTKSTPRPDQYAWRALLDGLVDRGMRQEANDRFKVLHGIAEQEGLSIRMVDRLGVFELNERYLRDSEATKEERNEIFALLRDYVFDQKFIDSITPAYVEHHSQVLGRVAALLATDPAWYGEAIGILDRFVRATIRSAREAEQVDGSEASFRSNLAILSKLITDSTMSVLDGILNLEPLNALPVFHGLSGLYEATQTSHYDSRLNEYCVETLKKIRARGELAQLSDQDWRMFFGAGVRVFMMPGKDQDAQLQDFRELCEEASKAGFSAPMTPSILPARAFQTIARRYGPEADAIIQTFPEEWALVARDTKMRTNLPDVSPSVERDANIVIDKVHSRLVDEFFPAHPTVTLQTAYARYEEGKKKGIYPLPDVLGRLISSLGRVSEMEKVHQLYNDGQQLLTLYESNRQLQSHFWYCLEDQMIIAMAHAGYIEKAHVHRQRIISHGGVPSADSYGGLIQCVRETTDDSSNALALWQEAVQFGVVPNMYLYNTIISKLSRARKADLALDLFRQMKANRIRPSSVTYGAVIAACCRVGDAQSAEVLFEEMTSQQNFRPRIPPYNTMIQFYTHTVRDRERALFYYNALLSTGIKPTSHTYKLLIDCYGSTEPADMAAMEDVFAKLVADHRVRIAGVHWAALINAYGCVQKDLDKATQIFDSIASHPSTLQSGSILPDAIVYEAMINVLVTLRHIDLIPSYLERLASSGVHMTAYIANLLIKGYATTGNLEKAREVFESLEDPPIGMAAPNNHTRHDDSQQTLVSVNAPVYREPSTWETMVRAELGNGNRDAAESLLLRVQERQFPPAVYGRISGIMLNDSVSPWFSGNEPSDGSASHSPQ